MTSLKSKLSSLFSSSLIECLHTSKELRKQVRDRVLLMLEEEIQDRINQQQTKVPCQSAVHKTAAQFGLSLPAEVEALGRECARCPKLLKERDEAVLKAQTAGLAAEHYKQQIAQLKEISKHHKAIAEGSMKVADGYIQTAANFHDGVSRADLMKERERILVQNNKMLESSLINAQDRLARAEKSLEVSEQEIKAQTSMIETLRKELQVTAHSLVSERKRVQEAELKIANLGPNARLSTIGSKAYPGNNHIFEDSFAEFEKQNSYLRSTIPQQHTSSEDLAAKDLKIKELEEDLATVRQEAGLIARGMGDELSKLTKQMEYMHEENLGMASQIHRLRAELIEANDQVETALCSQRTSQYGQRSGKQSKPASDLQNIAEIQRQLSSALEQVKSLQTQLARTRRLHLEEISLVRASLDLQFRGLLSKNTQSHWQTNKQKHQVPPEKQKQFQAVEYCYLGSKQITAADVLRERKENLGYEAN